MFDENLTIQEGMEITAKKTTYERSKKLRDYALSHFSKQGKIYCSCCGFNFSDFYGKDIGDNFIEIHHIKPIFQYKGDNITQTVKDAILNMTPLCSNCHRMIHRHRKEPLEIETLTQHIKDNGAFTVRT